MKILKLNEISPVADPVLREYEYSAAVSDPDGIILRSFSMHGYDFSDNLLAVARAGAGVNNIPVEECTKQGIVVFNTPGANANAVKELVLCELFLGGRKIIEGANWVQTLGSEENLSKRIEQGKSKFSGSEIFGKALGVIGLGAIGTAVANAATGLGMKVVGYDPYFSVKNALLLDSRVHIVPSLEELYALSDFITLHLPFTEETRNLIGSAALSACKQGVVLINNARGELVDSEALLESVACGKVARYLTDFPDPRFLGKENIICVPHLGASTPEAEDNCALMAAKQLADYLENGNIANSVNYPAMSMPRRSVCRVCVHHKNVKEILSKILSDVSSRGINIAHMQDLSKGDYAYLLLDLDERPNVECADALRAIPGVIRVRVL